MIVTLTAAQGLLDPIRCDKTREGLDPSRFSSNLAMMMMMDRRGAPARGRGRLISRRHQHDCSVPVDARLVLP
jgi:hypothetical protein